MIHDVLPPWLVVVIVGMLPILELRAALPLGVFGYGMSVVEAAAWSVLGNLIPVPLILALLPPIERWLRRWPPIAAAMDWFFARTRRRSTKTIERLEEVGLVLFVGVPLPGTGAWTGSLVAHLFAIPRRAALVAIAAGVVLAGVLVGAIVASGQWLWLLRG